MANGLGSGTLLVILTSGGITTVERYSDNTWAPHSTTIGTSTSGPTIIDIAVASFGSQVLHIVGVDSHGSVWHLASGVGQQGQWALCNSKGGPGFVSSTGRASIACAAVGEELHVVALGADGQPWHTILAGGAWQTEYGAIRGQSSGGPVSVTAVTCGTSDGKALQVIAVGDDANLWHTLRDPSGAWQKAFVNIETRVAAGTQKPSGFGIVACWGVPDLANPNDPKEVLFEEGLNVVGVDNSGAVWAIERFDAQNGPDQGFWFIDFNTFATPPSRLLHFAYCGPAMGLSENGDLWVYPPNDDGSTSSPAPVGALAIGLAPMNPTGGGSRTKGNSKPFEH